MARSPGYDSLGQIAIEGGRAANRKSLLGSGHRRTQRLKIRAGQGLEPSGPRGVEGAQQTELRRRRWRIDAMHANGHCVLAGGSLEAVDVVTQIPRHIT